MPGVRRQAAGGGNLKAEGRMKSASTQSDMLKGPEIRGIQPRLQKFTVV